MNPEHEQPEQGASKTSGVFKKTSDVRLQCSFCPNFVCDDAKYIKRLGEYVHVCCDPTFPQRAQLVNFINPKKDTASLAGTGKAIKRIKCAQCPHIWGDLIALQHSLVPVIDVFAFIVVSKDVSHLTRVCLQWKDFPFTIEQADAKDRKILNTILAEM